MFYLFIAIICSASIALIFKYTETKKMNRYLITTSNYFMAFSVSLFMILSKGVLKDFKFSNTFIDEFKLLSQGHIFSPSSSVVWGLIVGSITGIIFFVSFINYQKSVKENGVGLSGTISKLGVLVPIVISIVIWKESPTTYQWLGIILALSSIVIVNLSEETMQNFDVKPRLILLFVYGGIGEFSKKLFQKYALSEYNDVFLFTIFFTAFLISLTATIKSSKKFDVKDMLSGFVLGVPNLFSSYFLILSLASINASIAYPLYSAGSIVLINVGGYVIFKEAITDRGKLALILTVIALVLLNI